MVFLPRGYIFVTYPKEFIIFAWLAQKEERVMQMVRWLDNWMRPPSKNTKKTLCVSFSSVRPATFPEFRARASKVHKNRDKWPVSHNRALSFRFPRGDLWMICVCLLASVCMSMHASAHSRTSSKKGWKWNKHLLFRLPSKRVTKSRWILSEPGAIHFSCTCLPRKIWFWNSEFRSFITSCVTTYASYNNKLCK